MEHSFVTDERKMVTIRPAQITHSIPLAAVGSSVRGPIYFKPLATSEEIPLKELGYTLNEAPEDGKIVRCLITVAYVEDYPIIQEKLFLGLPMTDAEWSSAIRQNYFVPTLSQKVQYTPDLLNPEERLLAISQGLLSA
jgi:hypothetical protein